MRMSQWTKSKLIQKMRATVMRKMMIVMNKMMTMMMMIKMTPKNKVVYPRSNLRTMRSSRCSSENAGVRKWRPLSTGKNKNKKIHFGRSIKDILGILMPLTMRMKRTMCRAAQEEISSIVILGLLNPNIMMNKKKRIRRWTKKMKKRQSRRKSDLSSWRKWMLTNRCPKRSS